MDRSVGESARRYAQLQEQRRYELEVSAEGITALLEPYALRPEARIPQQRTATEPA